MENLYSILNLSSEASPSDIKYSYRALAKKYHPDLNPGNKSFEEKFKTINSAYEVLSDPIKKQDYDLSLKKSSSSSSISFSIYVPFEKSVFGGLYSFSFNYSSFEINIPIGIKSGETLLIKNAFFSKNLLLTIFLEPSNYSLDQHSNIIKTIDISLKTAMFGDKIEINTLYKKVFLTIPKNTKHNQKFRLKNFGIPLSSYSFSDLYIIINIVIPPIESLDKTLIKNLKNRLP